MSKGIIQMKKISAIIIFFLNLIIIYPSSADDYIKTGNKYFKEGNYKEAIIYYKKAVEIDPSLWNIYSNIGICYSKEKKYDLAVLYYSKSIELNPKSYVL